MTVASRGFHGEQGINKGWLRLRVCESSSEVPGVFSLPFDCA